MDEAHTIKKWLTIPIHNISLTSFHRRGSFRKVFLKVRSLAKQGVNVMALTATATTAVRHEVEQVIIIIISPAKANIFYAVRRYGTLCEAFTAILEQLKSKCCEFPRTLIHCTRFSDYTFIQGVSSRRIYRAL